MKFKRIITLTALAVVFTNSIFSQVGIGTTTPAASAELDVTSTTKGFLPPRMTHAQKTAIVSPVAGLIVWCIDCGSIGETQIYNGTTWTNMVGGAATAPFTCGTSTVTFTYNGASVTYGTVSSTGSKCWLDRNLGATQVATSSTDHLAYGDLFQWGRGADGHQLITRTNATTATAVNGTTATLSSTDTPGNNTFITNGSSPFDWLSPQNDNLWQGVSGINNPCPSGYRLPTETELNNERLSWVQAPISSTNTAAGAFASPLKLPMSGSRGGGSGSIVDVGTGGVYWGSAVSGADSRFLFFDSYDADMYIDNRANGFAVRCLKD
jgi:hypothetical protein